MISCSEGSNPKSVVNKYLDAKLSSNFQLAYSTLSTEDKSLKSLEEYLKENDAEEFHAISKAFSEKSSYKIISITKEKKQAHVTVELTVPDGKKIAGELMFSLFSKMFDENFNEKEMASMMEEKYKDKAIPMTTKTDTLHLVNEDEGWLVFLDWTTEKIEREKKEKINILLSEAENLKEEKKLIGAIEKYDQVLELDSKMVDAIEGIEEINTEIKTLEEKQAYINKVELYDLKARYYDTYFDGKIPGVAFKLRNKGNQTLNKVEITVYFKDASGSIIFEENFHPVLVSEYSFSDNKPLKPNYVWSMGKDKYYQVEEVPSEWKAGSVSAKITDIEFE
jgi:hypothetical protein